MLPEYTLGWQILRWVTGGPNPSEANLLADEPDEHDNPQPFKFTFEQTRLLLWWYAIDERGRFIYREGIIQRLKGWG